MRLRSPRAVKYKSSDLFRSVSEANISQFDAILTVNAHLISEKTKDGGTVLHLAAESGHIGMFQHIAAKYPDLLKEKNKSGATVLHHAAVNGKEEGMVVHVATTYPNLLNERNKKGITLSNAISRSRIPRKRSVAEYVSDVQLLIDNLKFREFVACILYSPESNLFNKLEENLSLKIIAYSVARSLLFIPQLKALCLDLAARYLQDKSLTAEEFVRNQSALYTNTHIKAASKFMARVIMKTYNEDTLQGFLTSAQLPEKQALLQEWLSTTLLRRMDEYGGVINKEFRQGIMHVVQKAMLIESTKVFPRTKSAVDAALNTCITNWVRRITPASTEQVAELQLCYS
jgi:hypothetical protein